MAFDKHGNLVKVTVTVAPSPATSGTTLSISNTDATALTTAGLTAPFNMVAQPTSSATETNVEIIRVTDIGAADSGGTGNTQLTITRTAETQPGSARSILVGDYLTNNITTKVLTDIENNINGFIYDETPSGTVNGTNTTFTLANTPISGSLQLYRDGQLMNGGGNDYSLSGATITFTTAPVTGSVLLAYYSKVATGAGVNAATLNGYVANATPTASEIPVLDSTVHFPASTMTDGWISLPATLTYGTTDGHTFTATATVDLTPYIGVGDRIKLTNQSATQYFIVTAIAYATGTTTLTLYGGTTYSITNTAITNPYFSHAKAPLGFPLRPDYWTERLTDDTGGSQTSPTAGVWYNVQTALNLTIPIGAWDVQYFVHMGAGTINGTCICNATLSTANNSESDTDLTSAWGTTTNDSERRELSKRKTIVLTSKTTYYLNISLNYVGTSINSINLYHDRNARGIVQAICAYL